MWDSGILYYTNNEDEVNIFLLETRIKQLEFMLDNARACDEKYKHNKQAYTYKFIEKL